MKRCVTMMMLIFAFCLAIRAEKGPCPDIIRRIYRYASTIDTSAVVEQTSYAYTRFKLHVERKNPTLLLVPSFYAIAHSGQREYVGETYNRITMHRLKHIDSETLLRVTTVPRRHRAMPNILKYLTPAIYDETVIDNYLLSPFHRHNRSFYRYTVDSLREGTIRITFRPKRKNTQLVSGDAVVDSESGRILKCYFTGEYDMVNFWLTLYMGKKGMASMMPEKCELRTRFRFIRSKVSGRYVAYYNLPQVLTDSIATEDDFKKMCFVRPDTLDAHSMSLYQEMYTGQRQHDSVRALTQNRPVRKNLAKIILWDIIGDNVLNRVKTNFGINNQGYIRLNPILNPLYMGYDHRRGFTYKFDIRTSYQFGDNTEISARLKAGYAFKQRQFYYRVPVFFYFDKQRNGYLQLETGNGNRIGNQSVRKSIEQLHPDTAGMNLPHFDLLNEFKQNDLRIILNCELSDKWGLQIGSLYQRRVAVHQDAFERLGIRKEYRSFSPLVQLQYRPLGWKGPIFTADYDRGLKNVFRANTAYERMEFNAEYIHHLHQLRCLKMRFGTGFYTWKDRMAYFLNYENFRENNIPGGWTDDWSGGFELLRGDTYNNSEYYIRSNITYESPLLLFSWLPYLGHYMEMERVYLSILDVRNIHPYIELGYGFTTRLFSCGLFVSNGRGNRTIGCKFGFELFRRW